MTSAAAPAAGNEGGLAPYTLRELLAYFVRLGSLGFGGPVALVGFMQRDLVDERRWISEKDFKEGLALAQLAPGPLAAQLAIYLGWLHHGVLGATWVAFAFVMPSFVMVLALSALYVSYLHNKSLQQVLTDIGRFALNRVMEPRMLSFFRIGIAEASHIPELSRAMKTVGPQRIHQMLADIFRFYAAQGVLPTQDFMRAAESYCELLIATPRTKALFGVLEPDWDAEAHVAFVVSLFLRGLEGMEPVHAA